MRSCYIHTYSLSSKLTPSPQTNAKFLYGEMEAKGRLMERRQVSCFNIVINFKEAVTHIAANSVFFMLFMISVCCPYYHSSLYIGAPKESVSILKLREAVNTYRGPETGPVIVHCR